MSESSEERERCLVSGCENKDGEHVGDAHLLYHNDVAPKHDRMAFYGRQYAKNSYVREREVFNRTV